MHGIKSRKPQENPAGLCGDYSPGKSGSWLWLGSAKALQAPLAAPMPGLFKSIAACAVFTRGTQGLPTT